MNFTAESFRMGLGKRGQLMYVKHRQWIQFLCGESKLEVIDGK